jgi:alpha-N-arabinofuranosidase
MNPDYYGNLYRRYQTYIRNYNPEHRINKICCGANAGDYEWTDVVMKTCFKNAEHFHGFMEGLSLHYYTVPNDWMHKGSATKFNEDDWYNTLKKTLFMKELIERHTAIMDKYDKDHKVGLMVDEWGTWYDVEPGTNPGFLYQQNTMRDALVAGINLNIFNKHCDRVKMANIAQLVNVLQSVLLTEGPKMVKTPTYYVFKMYNVHQDAELLDSYVETEEIGSEKDKVPNLSESVSVDKNGTIHVTLCNLSCKDAYDVKVLIADKKVKSVSGEILTNKMDAYNTFDAPEKVKTKRFKANVVEDGVELNIPACSVIQLSIK